jgi:hypothetical protein
MPILFLLVNETPVVSEGYTFHTLSVEKLCPKYFLNLPVSATIPEIF